MKRIALFFALIFTLFSASAVECTPTGTFKGQLKSFSTAGTTYLSWYGTMSPDGLPAALANAPWNIWKFAVKDRDVGTKVDAAFKAGGSVVVEYCAPSAANPALQGNVVTDVVVRGGSPDLVQYEVGKSYVWQNQVGWAAYLNGTETVVLTEPTDQCFNKYNGASAKSWPTSSPYADGKVVCAEPGDLRSK